MRTQKDKRFFLFIKRIFDVTFGTIGCIVLVPIALIVKTAYLLYGDTAPIIYTQERIGLNGRKFDMYKFRSMDPHAEETFQDLLEHEEYMGQWERKQKLDADPRITPVGAFLRRSSLDEFPQFINVVKGEMSVVGPRPLVEGELERHNGSDLYRQAIPGMTGWWACNGRSNISYRKRLELEYYYVRNCSLYLDALCIFKTVAVVIRGDGAR